MEEQASFEARAILGPRRARRTRLELLVPVIALAAIAWAGVSGARPDQSTAEAPEATVAAAPSVAAEGSTAIASTVPRPTQPTQAFGLDVQPLDDVQLEGFERNEIFVISGWYVPTAITDCPRLAAIYRDGALPDVRGDTDVLAFCARSGVLYAARPDLRENRFTERRAIPAKLVVGVIAPLGIETIGGAPREVVVIGRFAEGLPTCHSGDGCRPVLLIDHVSWMAGA